VRRAGADYEHAWITWITAQSEDIRKFDGKDIDEGRAGGERKRV
jgi:hypothetical protein